MSLDDIPVFEQRNNLIINVYGIHEQKIVPYYLSKFINRLEWNVPTIHLLLTESASGHYSLSLFFIIIL